MKYWECKKVIRLRDYQIHSIDRVISYIKRNPEEHPLIALPTGSGKSYVISGVINRLINEQPDINILVISHVQEILEQDYKSIQEHSELTPGMYSAALNRKEIKQVTIAGIQSIHRTPEYFSKFTFIIIDECHLVSPKSNTMYRKFLKAMPQAVCFGVTATPFRLGSGYIYGQEDSIFDDLIYDLTSKKQFSDLIEQGYLCNLRTKCTDIELDTDGIKTTSGDFDNKMMSDSFDVDRITSMAIEEIIAKGENRKKWLIFAIDIDHAENITRELVNNGIAAMAVHSKMDIDRSAILRDFSAGDIKCVVNVNVLTTGFDDPEIDLIALLRPTKSPVIHIQSIGRGLRTSPGKKDCLVLDFAGNTERLGPINDVTIIKKGKGKKIGEPITKRCPDCNEIVAPAVRICPSCGHAFSFKTSLNSKSSDANVVETNRPPAWAKVSGVTYQLHNKPSSPSMMKVTYECGLRYYSEYICIEHTGYSRYKAKHWLEYRGLKGVSTSIMAVHKSSDLKKPSRILVDRSGKYPVISDYSF